MGKLLNKVFLGWERPLLQSTADYLIDRYTDGSQCDLENLLLVVPVSRAARRLEELLALRAEDKNLWLIPPQIITAGILPETLLDTKEQFVTHMEQTALWLTLFEELESKEKQILFKSHSSSIDLVSVSEQVLKVFAELSGIGKSFKDVAEVFRSDSVDFEDSRWEILTLLFAQYKDRLSNIGLRDKNVQRREVAESSETIDSSFQHIFLVGVADLLVIHQKILDKTECEISSLIFSSQEEEAGFNRYGSLETEYWLNKKCIISDSQIHSVLNPYEQAERVVRTINSFSQDHSAEQISIGISSEEFEPYIQQQLEVHSVPCRVASGVPLVKTSPVRLLDFVGRFITSKNYQDFSVLIRHIDMNSYVSQKTELSENHILTLLDKYQSRHLQAFIKRNVPGSDKDAMSMNTITDCIYDLLAPFLESNKSAVDWKEIFLKFFEEIYGLRQYSESSYSDREFIEVFNAVASTLNNMSNVRLAYYDNISSRQMIRFLLREMNNLATTPEPMDEAVELLGWLEVSLDDAECLFMAGLNEGLVPESLNEDLLLPNSLRSTLGLLDNDRRFARDIFSLSTILHSKKKFQCSFSRRSSSNDPLRPSRLLFLDTDMKIVERVRNLSENKSEPKLIHDADTFLEPLFSPFEPAKSHLFENKMSVTGFRDYIRCPYRYYLKHIMRLQNITDEVYELNAMEFGILIHDIFNSFAKSEFSDSTEEKEILDFLLKVFIAKSHEIYGEDPLPAVFVQLEQIKIRLALFAEFQASWRSSGWSIMHSEYSFHNEDAVFLEHSRGKTELRGTIDRIDRHKDGRIIIFDYKTGDNVFHPDASHQTRDKEWFDLQLPLYSFMLERKGLKPDGGVGYIPISKSEKKIKPLFATWSQSESEEAVEIAREIAASVQAQNFWPPTEWVGNFDDFADMLGVGQFGAFRFEEGVE